MMETPLFNGFIILFTIFLHIFLVKNKNPIQPNSLSNPIMSKHAKNCLEVKGKRKMKILKIV